MGKTTNKKGRLVMILYEVSYKKNRRILKIKQIDMDRYGMPYVRLIKIIIKTIKDIIFNCIVFERNIKIINQVFKGNKKGRHLDIKLNRGRY